MRAGIRRKVMIFSRGDAYFSKPTQIYFSWCSPWVAKLVPFAEWV